MFWYSWPVQLSEGPQYLLEILEEFTRSLNSLGHVNGIGLDVSLQATNDMSRSSILQHTNLAMAKWPMFTHLHLVLSCKNINFFFIDCQVRLPGQVSCLLLNIHWCLFQPFVAVICDTSFPSTELSYFGMPNVLNKSWQRIEAGWYLVVF